MAAEEAAPPSGSGVVEPTSLPVRGCLCSLRDWSRAVWRLLLPHASITLHLFSIISGHFETVTAGHAVAAVLLLVKKQKSFDFKHSTLSPFAILHGFTLKVYTPWTGPQSVTYTHHSLSQAILSLLSTRTGMFLDYRMVYWDKTHSYMVRTCKLHSESPLGSLRSWAHSFLPHVCT